MYKKLGILAIAVTLLLFASAGMPIGKQLPGKNPVPVVTPPANGTGYFGDITIQGTAISKFARIGAWGWNVYVDKVVQGPTEMQGKTISVYLTSADPKKYPPWFLDPTIDVGNIVEAYGGPVSGNYNISLTGDANYYLKYLGLGMT
ncbi:MAG: hypothetical protein NTV25_07960 [Methanothrix sp.]|nr:hypothetical protein [Methanothrix sp.]